MNSTESSLHVVKIFSECNEKDPLLTNQVALELCGSGKLKIESTKPVKTRMGKLLIINFEVTPEVNLLITGYVPQLPPTQFIMYLANITVVVQTTSETTYSFRMQMDAINNLTDYSSSLLSSEMNALVNSVSDTRYRDLVKKTADADPKHFLDAIQSISDKEQEKQATKSCLSHMIAASLGRQTAREDAVTKSISPEYIVSLINLEAARV